MAKQTGLGHALFVDQFDISGDIQMAGNISGGPAALDMTDITQSAYARLGGLRNGNMDVTSFFNKATDREHLVFRSLPTTDRIETYCCGTSIGKAAASMIGKQINYDGNRANDGMFVLAVNGQSNGFGLEWGELLTAGKRTDTVATNGASYDAGVGVGTTAFGLQMYVHLIAFTGTSVTIAVQSSTDDGAGDAFAAVTGATTGALTTPQAVRVQTGSTASVERYLRVVTTGTFSNAVFLVNVARNLTATVF